MKRADLAHMRRFPGTVTRADLVRAARERGWVHDRTAGGHEVWIKDGYPSHIVIPSSLKGTGVKRNIIRHLMAAEGEE